MSEAVDLTPIERALQAWVVRASGLPDASVIWSGYGRGRPKSTTAPPPDSQWISLKFTATNDDAWPWADYVPNPLVFTAFAFTADPSTPPGVLLAPAHGLVTGDGPVRLTTTAALPGGLAIGVDYWIIVVDANTLRLAVSFRNAVADTPVPVSVTTAGTGTHTLSATADTVRAGEEQLEVLSLLVEGTLSIQCYGGPPTGSRSPMNVLRTVVTNAMKTSERIAFEDAGITVTATGRINDLTEIISMQRVEPRAHVDISVTFIASTSEPSTTIETTEVTVETVETIDDQLAVPLGFPLGEEESIQTADVTLEISRG